MKKRSTIVLTSLMLSLSLLLASCGSGGASNTDPSSGKDDATKTNESATDDSSSEEDPSGDDSDLTWPENKITLKYWTPFSGNASVAMSSFDDHEVYKKMEEITNIEMVFEHPSDQNVDFNLMIADAADTLPDIIEYSWVNYQGGPQAAINDGIIISLNELLDTVAPDAKTAQTATDIIERHTKTDEGHVFSFQPVLKPDWDVTNANNIDLVQFGPLVRKDWLDQLELDVPETIEEWNVALRGFRDEFGATAPLSVPGFHTSAFQTFAGVFNTTTGFYQRDGEVKYGPMDDSYKDFLLLMSQWYDEGLLDPDFSSIDSATVDNNVLAEKTGLFMQYTSRVQTHMNAMEEKVPSFELIGTPYPDMLDGSEPLFMFSNPGGVRNTNQAAITTNNKHPEHTAMYFNYFYTEEGMLLKNFGLEGETWNLSDDGSIIMTDRVYNSPEGYSSQQAMGVYTRGDVPSPGYLLKVLDLTTEAKGNRNQVETLRIWSKESANAEQVILPVGITQTTAEDAIISQYQTNVNDFFLTSMLQFIMGTQDIETGWDNYISQLNSLGIEEIITHKQAALDRYNQR